MGIWLGLLTGLMGSIHCLGMCGPIALALPGSENSKSQLIWGRILYNIGRSLTYALLGAIAGLLGFSLNAFGSQQSLSIIMGIIIVLMAILPNKATMKVFPFLNNIQFPDRIKDIFNRSLKKGTPGSLFIIGILNGFLPCGLVYIAIAGAIAMGDVFLAALYMFLFGLGTSPAMFGMSLVGNFFNLELRRKFSRLIPVFGVILGILFIMRGLNLGIPLISPTEEKIEKKLEQKKKVQNGLQLNGDLYFC